MAIENLRTVIEEAGINPHKILDDVNKDYFSSKAVVSDYGNGRGENGSILMDIEKRIITVTFNLKVVNNIGAEVEMPHVLVFAGRVITRETGLKILLQQENGKIFDPEQLKLCFKVGLDRAISSCLLKKTEGI